MSVTDAHQKFTGRKLADSLIEIENENHCKLPVDFETHLKPMAGIADCLDRVTHAKCVASNGPLQKIKRNLQITGLSHYFGENIFSAYTIQKWKPEPDLFLHACREMTELPRLIDKTVAAF